MCENNKLFRLPSGKMCSVGMIERVIENSVETSNKKDILKLYNECLHEACREGNIEVVKYVLKKGAVFDHCNKYRESLDIMCKNKYTLYTIIIKVVTATNFNDWDRGLLAACRSNNYQIIKYMEFKGARYWGRCLEDACERENIEMVGFILQHKTKNTDLALDLNSSYDNSLRAACFKGNMKIVKMLISTGNEFYWDAGLRSSCLSGHVKLAKLMISKGADNWFRGFEAACSNYEFDVGVLMIHSGVDLESALLEACDQNFVKMVEFILTKKAHAISADVLDKALYQTLTEEYIYECKVSSIITIAKLLIDKGAIGIKNILCTFYSNSDRLIEFVLNNIDLNNRGIIDELPRLMYTGIGIDNIKCDTSYRHIVLINKGVDVSKFSENFKKYLCETESFQLYCWCCKNIDNCVLDKEKYDKILKVYPPYVLLSLSRTYKIPTSRLPRELFRLIFVCLH